MEFNEIKPENKNDDEQTDGAHLSTFVIDQGNEETEDQEFVNTNEDGEKLEDENKAPMTEDAFFNLFCDLFLFPSFLDSRYAPLAVQENELEHARKVSDFGYKMILQSFPALLLPQAKMIGDLIVIGSFFKIKASLFTQINREIKIQNQEPINPVNESEETNDHTFKTKRGAASPMAWMDATQ